MHHEYIINTSNNVHQRINNVTVEIIQDTITTNDSTITTMSTMLDTENEENTYNMNGINGTYSPCTIHSAVLPKPSLIVANVNLAINAMWKLIHPDNTNTNDTHLFDEAISKDNHKRCRPIITVTHESSEPIVKWMDKNKLLSGNGLFLTSCCVCLWFGDCGGTIHNLVGCLSL